MQPEDRIEDQDIKSLVAIAHHQQNMLDSVCDLVDAARAAYPSESDKVILICIEDLMNAMRYAKR